MLSLEPMRSLLKIMFGKKAWKNGLRFKMSNK